MITRLGETSSGPKSGGRLPGKVLNLSALLTAKKFHGKGNKEGAVSAFQEMEKAGLGTLNTEDSRRGASAVIMYT